MQQKTSKLFQETACGTAGALRARRPPDHGPGVPCPIGVVKANG